MTIFRQTGEVARALGVSEWTVRKLRSRGLLVPAAMTAGGTCLFSDDEIARTKVRLAQERSRKESAQ